jgi:chromosome segregation ATPase
VLDLTQVNKEIAKIAKEKEKIQARLEELLQRRQELTNKPLPKKDFIDMIIEEQGLRENELSRRLFKIYGRRLNEPMSPMKIRGRDDSPLCWPIGENKIPNDVWHVIFGKQINAAITEAAEKWEWPEDVGPTRAERQEELERIGTEIEELKAWLNQAAMLSPQNTGNSTAPAIFASKSL